MADSAYLAKNTYFLGGNKGRHTKGGEYRIHPLQNMESLSITWCFPPRKIQGMTGGHSLGGTCGHNKAHGLSTLYIIFSMLPAYQSQSTGLKVLLRWL